MRETIKKAAGLVLIVLVAWQLLAASQVAGAGVRQALGICGSVLIPSLFPFMVLAALLPSTAAGRLLAKPFGLVARLLYRMRPAVAPALLMSWIGGYPAGARTLAELVDRGELTPDEAGEALCCCVNSGPAFMVTVVGAGILGSPSLGMQLYGCQLVAGILTGLVMGVRVRRRRVSPAMLPDKPFAEVLTSAVTSAATAMVSMCAFVLLMGGTVAVMEHQGVIAVAAQLVGKVTLGWIAPDTAGKLVAGLLEIVTGVTRLGNTIPLEALQVLPFMLSFGGVAVICQVMAAVGGRAIPLRRFLLSRPLHGLVTTLLAYPLLRGSCAAVTTGLITSPTLHQDSRTLPAVALMLASCAFLCLVVEEGNNKVL